jgi:hypothetical protein
MAPSTAINTRTLAALPLPTLAPRDLPIQPKVILSLPVSPVPPVVSAARLVLPSALTAAREPLVPPLQTHVQSVPLAATAPPLPTLPAHPAPKESTTTTRLPLPPTTMLSPPVWTAPSARSAPLPALLLPPHASLALKAPSPACPLLPSVPPVQQEDSTVTSPPHLPSTIPSPLAQSVLPARSTPIQRPVVISTSPVTPALGARKTSTTVQTPLNTTVLTIAR